MVSNSVAPHQVSVLVNVFVIVPSSATSRVKFMSSPVFSHSFHCVESKLYGHPDGADWDLTSTLPPRVLPYVGTDDVWLSTTVTVDFVSTGKWYVGDLSSYTLSIMARSIALSVYIFPAVVAFM